MTIAQLLSIFFCCIIFILLCCATDRYPIGLIRNAYKMTKPTFNRSLKILSPSIAKSLQGKRYYTSKELRLITDVFGFPGQHQTTTKAKLVKQLETTYKALRTQVKEFPEKCGITLAQYSNLTKLPPVVVNNIASDFRV